MPWILWENLTNRFLLRVEGNLFRLIYLGLTLILSAALGNVQVTHLPFWGSPWKVVLHTPH